MASKFDRERRKIEAEEQRLKARKEALLESYRTGISDKFRRLIARNEPADLGAIADLIAELGVTQALAHLEAAKASANGRDKGEMPNGEAAVPAMAAKLSAEA